MEQLIRIGLDTSKRVFQLHGVDAEERAVLRRKLRRGDVLSFFGKLAPTRIGMGAAWLSALVARKPPKLAAVALANKTARIAWKMMVTGDRYDPCRHRAHHEAGVDAFAEAA